MTDPILCLYQYVAMLKLQISKAEKSSFRVLLLGAHSDDIEIGCGGTILRLVQENPEIEVHWVVFSAQGDRGEEAKKSAQEFLREVRQKQVMLHEFKDGYFPYVGGQIKDVFEKLKGEFVPDLIFTHCRYDRHQDHRLIEELTWNTFRDHLILEYEIPKYDGDMGTPNFYISLDEKLAMRKVQHLNEAFLSQSNKYWFTDDTFLALMRLRGMESRAESRYAEGFYAYKVSY